ncbi:hypothetical protein CEM_114 [Candidatus Johnevansia muelleri]|uniref:Uncharacterized protein n=1 Tax=Candidatus Johnevansia muelleri TaxID=1495769 RepID=A0A078KED5_9GAMM|nr:hypothetical protein CEM_114 [Candidatus Evansia muelleri]
MYARVWDSFYINNVITIITPLFIIILHIHFCNYNTYCSYSYNILNPITFNIA